MQKQSFGSRKKYILKERKLEKIHFRIIFGLVLANVLHYMYFEHKTIGQDFRYLLFIFLLPVLTGILILGLYRRQFLLIKLADAKGIFVKAFLVLFFLIQGFLFSYLSFGFVANTAWNFINYKIANQNPTKIIHGNIARFTIRLNNSKVEFDYNNHPERIHVAPSSLKQFSGKKPSDLKIKIAAQKGIWNYYVVKSWEIKSIR